MLIGLSCCSAGSCYATPADRGNVYLQQNQFCYQQLNLHLSHFFMNHGSSSPENQDQHQGSSQKNLSYGIQIPTKQEVKHMKRKVEMLKQAIIKQRSDRQNSEQQLQALNKRYLETEQALQKKEEKNQNLLHESRQLKDILIRQKQQIKNIEAEIQMLTEKRRKAGARSSRTGQPTNPTQSPQPQGQGWKTYLTSFWK